MHLEVLVLKERKGIKEFKGLRDKKATLEILARMAPKEKKESQDHQDKQCLRMEQSLDLVVQRGNLAQPALKVDKAIKGVLDRKVSQELKDLLERMELMAFKVFPV